MTEAVSLKIEGRQRMNGEEDKTEQEFSVACYYKRNNSHYVLYEETEGGKSTQNVIKFRDGMLELTKKGYVNTRMLFETGKQNLSDYATPFGMMRLVTDTDRVLVKEEENRIFVKAVYALEADGAPLADCVIFMEILGTTE